MKNNKKIIKATILTFMLSISSLSFAYNYEDNIEMQILSDQLNIQRAIDKVKNEGYEIIDIDADVNKFIMGKRYHKVIEIEAIKNNQEYDFIIEYPSLRIIQKKID